MSGSSSDTVRENSNATVREGSDETVRESSNATVREESGATVRESGKAAGAGVSNTSSAVVGVGAKFRGYPVLRQLPSKGSEADIYILKSKKFDFVLKLYRLGITPKADVLKNIQKLSIEYPGEFLKIFGIGFDEQIKRWYEFQEYAQGDSLQTLMNGLDASNRNDLFDAVLREIVPALKVLHKNNMLHLDLKPSNILARSLDPLDLVLIDFGTATNLESDMTKKFTQARGTPMYQSPEQWGAFAGKVAVGRPSDWWALGMMLLEIAAGKHPFADMSPNVIASSISTRPVDITDSIEQDRKELLHGLLTRDPSRRWGAEQVERWMNGERGIPQYFEEAVQTAEPMNNVKPFAFMGMQCRTLSEIAGAFIKDEASWEKGRALLMRGNIRTWLEQNGEFEQGEDLERSLEKAEDADERMCRFISQYGDNLPFALCGHLITLQNLTILVGRSARLDKLSPCETKILEMLCNGRLASLLNIYIRNRKISDELRQLRNVLKILKGKSKEDIALMLSVSADSNRYHCPFLSSSKDIVNVLSELDGLSALPMMKEEWEKLDAEYILPHELVSQMSSAADYHTALSRINKMKDDNMLMRRNMADDGITKKLASASMKEYYDALYEMQWGYSRKNVAAIESSLKQFRAQKNSAGELEKAQLDLWISYLEFLSKRKIHLEQADEKLLENAALSNTDEVLERMRAVKVKEMFGAVNKYLGAVEKHEHEIQRQRQEREEQERREQREREERARAEALERQRRWELRRAKMEQLFERMRDLNVGYLPLLSTVLLLLISYFYGGEWRIAVWLATFGSIVLSLRWWLLPYHRKTHITAIIAAVAPILLLVAVISFWPSIVTFASWVGNGLLNIIAGIIVLGLIVAFPQVFILLVILMALADGCGG